MYKHSTKLGSIENKLVVILQIRDPNLPHREDKHGAKAAVDAGADESDEDESSDEEEDETRGTFSYALISSVVTWSPGHAQWHNNI